MGKKGMRDGLAGVPAGRVPLSPTSPSKAGSRNPPPPLSPLLVQLCTVSKMTAYGELGDAAMSKLGRRASLAGGGGRGKRGGGVGGGGGGGVWGGGEVGAAKFGGDVFDPGCVNAFLAPALSRVMRDTVPIPGVAALLCCILLLLMDLSQVMWGPSRHLGSFTVANWVSFDFNVSYSSF